VTTRSVHPEFVVPPPPVRQLDVLSGDSAGVLPDDMEQDKEVARASIEDPVKAAADMAAQLAQSSFDLRGSREGRGARPSGSAFISPT
jgi:hypothetical protein